MFKNKTHLRVFFGKWRLLCLLLFAAVSLPSTAAAQEEKEVGETLIRQMVDFTALALKDMDPSQPGLVPRNDEHTHDPDPCYAMAFLYKNSHPLNPCYGKPQIRDTAIAICDRIAATKMRPEWPLYLVCQVYDLLKDEIPEEKRVAWKAYAEDYVATRAMQPYFFTSPNHQAWNALAASKKLADFMIRYSFPDGSPIGAFDGRQSYSFGYFGTLCYGLDRWPLGKELNRRIYRTRKKWNILDVHSPYYSSSDWYAYFSSFFLADEYRSWLPEAPSKALPQDQNGYRMVESGDSFSGGVIRQNGWMVALSAIFSDVPRYGQGPYQLERQSRIDIWHEKTGLIVGGGHNMVGAEVPLANFLLLTGHHGVDADFGLITGGQIQDRQAAYFPRKLQATLEPEVQTLEASFGHADFWLASRPLTGTRLELEYRYDIVAATNAFFQLPVVLFAGSQVQTDGRAWDQKSPAEIERDLLIRNPTAGSLLRIWVPEGRDVLMRRPEYPLRWYGGEHKDQRYWPYYQIALVSVRLDTAAGKGGGKFAFGIGE